MKKPARRKTSENTTDGAQPKTPPAADAGRRKMVRRAAKQGEADNPPNLAALREASREHTDAFLVKTDLEDADQREASPGTREQD
ncbi:hypothetical protein FE844_032425 (plasmid) [Rhizobium indicum]|uniref:hypothetical protein n=1 Tax=Rhizobium TaxID=379 RepID=UPI001105A5F6|nr:MULTISPECIES: hypothetical protein [Rhizobium]NNU67866.1 hypothetical protein [Rhizobium sp. WYCCWR 11152]QKK34288.1 hypothetical protein FE844_032425 [Rhizobium indicum]